MNGERIGPFYLEASSLSVCVPDFSGSLSPHTLPTDSTLQDRFGLENAYSRFQPSLETVNPTAQVTQRDLLRPCGFLMP